MIYAGRPLNLIVVVITVGVDLPAAKKLLTTINVGNYMLTFNKIFLLASFML